MSTVLEQRGLPEAGQPRWRPWLALAAGLLALYVPTYLSLARTLWREDDYAHGPIILAVFAWLAWRELKSGVRDDFSSRGKSSLTPLFGALLLAAGILLYVVGRSQALPLFEVASHIPVIGGALLMMGGMALLRRFAFPLLILFFLIPLPGFLLETISTPLKALVSSVVAFVLGVAGYPVEREGVVLFVGDHQMLMADACSGLNSLYSLTALTLLYTHLTGPSTRTRWAVLLASIVPIAIIANIVRVLFLVLVAYHLGDEAAQGFLHGLAGMLVFVVAFLLLVGIDRLVKRKPETQRASNDSRGALVSPRTRPAYVAALLMLGAALAAPQLKPVRAEGAALDLQNLVPSAFGDWSIDTTVVPIPPTPDVQAKLDRIYVQTVNRAYVNSKGEQMMLTVAYGGDQSDALKAHRQEVCYTAQGFTIHGLQHGDLAASGRSIPVTRMLAVRGERSEPVTYWFTMGDRVVRGRAERLRMQLEQGLKGRIPDGMLVRVSNISTQTPQAFDAQQAFMGALLAAMPAADAARLVGAPRS